MLDYKNSNTIRIRDVADVFSGFAFKAEDLISEGIPVLKIANIQDKKVVKTTVSFFPTAKYKEKLSRYLYRQSDVLVAMTGEGSVGKFGKMLQVDQRYLVNQRVGILRPNIKDIDPEYFYQALTLPQYEEALYQLGLGAGQPNVSPKDIGSLYIPFPEFPLQQRIASILSAYDDLIEVNNQRIKLLEETARELYKEWFVRMRFPGYKKAKFVKGVPVGWEITTLADEVNFKMGQSPKSEFYNEDGNGLPFHQGVGTYGERFPEHKIFCSVNGRTAEEGDILFSVRAPVGRLNIADRKLIIGRGLSAMRHKRGLNNYLYYLLQHEFSKEDIIGNGSIFNSVGKDELKRFKIFQVGDFAKQFNIWVKPIDEQLLILIQQNTQLRQIRDRLLPRLISGKLEVKEINEIS